MSVGSAWRDPGSRAALYMREALERSAELAEQRAERTQLNVRSRDAADELERARRARRIVGRARSMLR
jgi:hypothetical protein